MASSNSQPLPTIHSENPAYSTLELHTPTTLLASPHLSSVFNLINHAFEHSHNKDGFSRLPPSEKARLQTHSQLGEEVGPDGFILLMLQPPPTSHPSPPLKPTEGFYSPSNHRVIGTASAKPYHPSTPIASSIDSTNSTHLFKRPPPSKLQSEAENDGAPQWEILAMAVDSLLQGRGLASQLMNSTIDEIKRRCGSGLSSLSPNSPEGNGKGQIMLLLSTMKDLNESYYLKKGWTTTETRGFPPGTMGSRDGFSVVEMSKYVVC